MTLFDILNKKPEEIIPEMQLTSPNQSTTTLDPVKVNTIDNDKAAEWSNLGQSVGKVWETAVSDYSILTPEYWDDWATNVSPQLGQTVVSDALYSGSNIAIDMSKKLLDYVSFGYADNVKTWFDTGTSIVFHAAKYAEWLVNAEAETVIQKARSFKVMSRPASKEQAKIQKKGAGIKYTGVASAFDVTGHFALTDYIPLEGNRNSGVALRSGGRLYAGYGNKWTKLGQHILDSEYAKHAFKGMNSTESIYSGGARVSNKWDLVLEVPDGVGLPKLPWGDWFPATSYTIDNFKTVQKTVNAGPISMSFIEDISYPTHMSISLYDNMDLEWYNWCKEYMHAVVKFNKTSRKITVLPYDKQYLKCTLIWEDDTLHMLHKSTYAVIPQIEAHDEIIDQPKEEGIQFSIVGMEEIDSTWL